MAPARNHAGTKCLYVRSQLLSARRAVRNVCWRARHWTGRAMPWTRSANRGDRGV